MVAALRLGAGHARGRRQRERRGRAPGAGTEPEGDEGGANGALRGVRDRGAAVVPDGRHGQRAVCKDVQGEGG